MTSSKPNLDEFLRDAFSQLLRSNADHKHAFRYVALATSGKTDIKQRMVVHHKFLEPGISHICTDSRTKKIADIENNPFASLLFYEYKKKLQVSVSTRVEVVKEGVLYDEYLGRISEHTLLDYSAFPGPGMKIADTSSFKGGDELYLNVLLLHWDSIDLLQLDRSGHKRAKYERVDDRWEGSWVVP